jgi:hypothetical protein
MQRLEVSCAVRPIYGSIGAKGLITSCSRVLLEKLTGFLLVKKSPALHGTRRYIPSFTSARHLSLSWARSIQSIRPHPTSWRFILILVSHLRLGLPSELVPSDYPPKDYIHLSFPHTCYMPRPSHSSRFDQPNYIGRGLQIIQLLVT